MLRVPYFILFYVLGTPFPVFHPGTLVFWANIMTWISVMIAVNKSKRKPHVSDIHSNHRTTLHCHFGFPSPLLPLQTGEKTYSILMLLNCMTSSMPGTKSRGGNMHIEEELCAKFFYYVYLCKWHIRLFKKSLRCSSSCCPLVRLSAAICTQSGSSQSPWLVFFFITKTI